MNIVLDTDIGSDVDDALALALLTRLPDVALTSVTTVGANTGVRAALARRLLEHAGVTDVPVAAGYGPPLPSTRFATMIPGGMWLGHEGRGVLTEDEITAASAPADPQRAIDQLIEAVESSPEPATVVTIGPLTNLAAALIARPDLRTRIGSHVAMGAVLGQPHDPSDPAASLIFEYNFNADREACAVVFEAGLPTLLIPGDFTARYVFGSAEVAQLRSVGHPVLADLVAMIDIWSPVYHGMLEQFGVAAASRGDMLCHLHDPLAVLAAVSPELFDIVPVRIDLFEEFGMLQTRVADDGAFAVHAAASADAPLLTKLILDSLLSFERAQSPAGADA